MATMALAPDEFIRRFLIHVLPSGFHRIRQYGLLAKGPNTVPLDALRALILQRTPQPTAVHADAPEPTEPKAATTLVCPCGGGVRIVEVTAGAAPGAPARSRHCGATAHELRRAPPSRLCPPSPLGLGEGLAAPCV
jgi:hypothetical protein